MPIDNKKGSLRIVGLLIGVLIGIPISFYFTSDGFGFLMEHMNKSYTVFGYDLEFFVLFIINPILGMSILAFSIMSSDGFYMLLHYVTNIHTMIGQHGFALFGSVIILGALGYLIGKLIGKKTYDSQKLNI